MMSAKAPAQEAMTSQEAAHHTDTMQKNHKDKHPISIKQKYAIVDIEQSH